jgi:two-component system, chemotaxis family, protein-glutamate methylesterase/glutaminase
VTAIAQSSARAGHVAAPARVMICDDSVVIRGAIARMLEADPEIQVVARVANGRLAIEELARTKVDVLILDIEMPVLDGISALPLLLKVDPGLRIIMASTLTTRGADIAMRALRLGAADYLPKPSAVGVANDEYFRSEIISKVKGLARMRRRGNQPAMAGTPVAPRDSGREPPITTRPAPITVPRLLAIGSSTGGPQALFTLIQALGRTVNIPVVLTQHMPPTFTPLLAEHITKLGGLPCAEAKDGEALISGHIHLAPGDQHLIVERQSGTIRARLSSGPPENFCRPAVDPMLRSAADAYGGRVLVAMLTGMGQDGLAGTRHVVDSGGAAIAQDEATSIVWGMPGAIARAGLCHAVLPLTRMAPKLLELMRTSAR